MLFCRAKARTFSILIFDAVEWVMPSAVQFLITTYCCVFRAC